MKITSDESTMFFFSSVAFVMQNIFISDWFEISRWSQDPNLFQEDFVICFINHVPLENNAIL